MKPKIALQLWTIKEAMAADFAGTLKAVKENGYDGVEFAGYQDFTATEIRHLLDENQLEVCASHIPFEKLSGDLAGVMAFERTIGNRRIVCPWLSFDNYQDWKAAFATLDEIGQTLTEAGFEFYYHNHAHEFAEVPGIDILHYLTAHTSYVKLEVDLYWVAKAGVAVDEWLLDHAPKIGLLHFKDLTADGTESTEIGHGVLPMKDYLAFAKEYQLPWLIVEQEAFQQYEPVEASRIDCDNLTALRDEVYA